MGLLDSVLGALPASANALFDNYAPTPAKLYVDTVLRGKRENITEANFTPEELATIRELVGRGQSGGVGYENYPGGADIGLQGLLTPQGRIANSLGQFNYQTDPQGTTVTDKYDFNPVYGNESLLLKLLGALGSGGFSPMHMLGEYLVPEGKGRNVNIRLPNK